MSKEEKLEAKITYEFNSLIDKEKLKEGIVENKKEYSHLLEDANKELEIFKKEYPYIYVRYVLSPVSNRFSIYNLCELGQKERMICLKFLNQINEMAIHHLEDK